MTRQKFGVKPIAFRSGTKNSSFFYVSLFISSWSIVIQFSRSSGGVVRVATIDKTGTKLELFRPDKPGFPGVVPPSAHPSFPPHIEQAPVA